MGLTSKARNALGLVGVDTSRLAATLLRLPRFVRDFNRYRRSSTGQGRFPARLRHLKPILIDYKSDAGAASGHYFFQDLWAARLIYEARPTRHVDIGSRIDGFVAHVLTFMPVEVIDI